MEPHALGNRHFFQMGSSETAQETPAIFLKEIRAWLSSVIAVRPWTNVAMVLDDLSICLFVYLSICLLHLISSHQISSICPSLYHCLSIYEIWHLLPYLPRSEATTTRRPYWRPSCRTLKRWCRKGCSPPWTGMEWPRSPLADAVNVWKSVVRRRCVKMGGF